MLLKLEYIRDKAVPPPFVLSFQTEFSDFIDNKRKHHQSLIYRPCRPTNANSKRTTTTPQQPHHHRLPSLAAKQRSKPRTLASEHSLIKGERIKLKQRTSPDRESTFVGRNGSSFLMGEFYLITAFFFVRELFELTSVTARRQLLPVALRSSGIESLQPLKAN